MGVRFRESENNNEIEIFLLKNFKTGYSYPIKKTELCPWWLEKRFQISGIKLERIV